MNKAKKQASEKYEKKRQIKSVSFNKMLEKELLDFANSVDFSEWVKDVIKQKIAAQKSKEIAKLKLEQA
ncbi:hypothetical protein [Acinetobacter sp. P1(2025)]|uniref:hypothetical protein n=1 Tax=Acinetobacter sp. P1(2025) TaxID=3446120 RepID=UPI003F53485D